MPPGRRKRAVSFGAWTSALTAEAIVSGALRFGATWVERGDLYWSESRPAEGGRTVVVRCGSDGEISDRIPFPFSARTHVHEYGGGAFAVHDGIVFFANDGDQRLFRAGPMGAPRAITPEGPERYADLVVDASRRRLVCVRERPRAGVGEPENAIVAVSIGGEATQRVLVDGNDFFAAPRLSPNGEWLAWLTWNHPNMPWDGSELWMGRVDADGSVVDRRWVAGGIRESILQPEWSPDGRLYFVSDLTGWWNLYRGPEAVRPVLRMDAELARPPWSLGQRQYAFESEGSIVCSYLSEGSWRLARLGADTGTLEAIPTPYTDLTGVCVVGEKIAFIGGSPTEMPSVVCVEDGSCRVLRRSSQAQLSREWISVPESIEFATTGEQKAYGYFYPPVNPECEGRAGEKPPLLVKCHGGPTGAASNTLTLETQYWTSRGFAVLDVNYRGSTGYGRAYRELLYGGWGVLDVEDCVAGARALAQLGKVDGRRTVIRGSSAGGYTALCALVFHEQFQAGAIAYGISDLEALARDTHKFEKHYTDRLVGPYPEKRELYRERSPIHFTERLSAPTIFFQGLEDRVVPPDQTERMVTALRAKGIPVACLLFAGEGHGFRRAVTIRRALEAEMFFYAAVFKLDTSERLPPIDIENL